MRRLVTASIAAMVFAAVCATTGVASRSPSVIVGSEFEYHVRAGDTWGSLGARYGVTPAVLATLNGRLPAQRVEAGETIRVDSRHLVPRTLIDGITINVPQRVLFLVRDDAVVAHYPVGLGRATWPTFIAPFTVIRKEVDPVWDVPVSIQEELRRQGKTVITSVGPGPSNPLGKYWLGLSVTGYGIHGTTAPLSIYAFQSHGCIRLHPDDIAALYAEVEPGLPGASVYEPVLLAVSGDDVLLEAHPDVYRRAGNALEIVIALADRHAVRERIDWNIVGQVLNVRDGMPHSVARLNRPSGR